MNKTKLNVITLFTIFLLIMLPIVEAQQVSSQNLSNTNSQNTNSQQISINANIPRYVRETVITITGTTTSNATVELYMKTVKKRQTNSTNDGTFTIDSVHLPETDNDIMLKATDNAGNTAQQNYTVSVDTRVPNFSITNFTTIATQPVLQIQASTDKPLNITYIATQPSTQTPPDKIQNLRTDKIDDTGIAIAWDASTSTNFQEYGIYRNGNRIATTPSAYYSDTQINSNTEYDYQISAVDTHCTEGQKSDTLITKSLSNNNQAIPEPSLATLTCTPQPKNLVIDHSGPFTIPVQLQEGTNQITITATDMAGHQVQYTNTTILDTLAPQIIETNLDQLSPTYIPDIKITGTLNKKATVFAYINNGQNPTSYTVSNDDGTFQIPIQLRRTINTTRSPQSVSLTTGQAWTNQITLKAVDAAGRTTTPITSNIIYSICGMGSWFNVDIGEPLPTKLTPRFLLQGIQQAGLTFNATYIGNYNVTLGQITINPVALSPELEDQYDNGLVDLNLLTQATNPKNILGYTQVMFRQWDFPTNTNMTEYDKEQNISMHRASSGPQGTSGTEKYGSQGTPGAPYLSSQYKNCLVPGIGCAKLFLEIDIPFQEKIPKLIIDPMTQKTFYKYDLQNHVQKVCMPVEMAMDTPVPPKLVPKSFLRAAIAFLDSAVNAMDTVLNPLVTIGTYVLYSCLAGTAWLYIYLVSETWTCDVQNYIAIASSISGGQTSAFDKSYAQAGLCKARYDEKSESYQKCKACQDKIDNTNTFQYDYLQPICDRVACPSAPTLQSQIRNSVDLEPLDIDQHSAEFIKWNVNGKVYSGDDCAFGPYQKDPLKLLSPTYTGSTGTQLQGPVQQGQPPLSTPGMLGIKNLYEITEGSTTYPNGGPSKQDCNTYPRPAHPACCGTSYMREWASACGPAPLYQTFDPLKESTCLAAQKANQKTIDPTLNCGGLFNAAAGFCDPQTGGETIDPIPTGLKYKDAGKPAAARTNEVYAIVIPTSMFKTRGGSTKTQTDYQVYRGYIAERYTTGIASTTKKQTINPSASRIEFDVNAKTSAISDGTDLTKYFQQEKQAGSQEKQDVTGFTQALCTDPVDPTSCRDGTKAKDVYERIYESIGASDQEYIVKPDQEGMLRSFQCVCLPALTSYLTLWRNILGATRDCMKSILLTGDGSEGVCKAVLSTYVCDLLFDVIKCFVQKFSAPGSGTRTGFGIGDFVGTLTKAGTETQRRIQGRYGDTALWKAMFVDKKLIHSICAFAFTGKWNFDVSGIFQQTVDTIPIQSQGFLTPCSRQFISFNPATQPKGQTTWTYHFGVGLAAGADVRYDLQLKCSQGFTCNPADGYKNGECDCNKKGEITRTIFAPELGTNTLRKNDILNKEVFYTIQSGTPDAAVRYDTAILKYTYTDPKTNKEVQDQTTCNIGLTGGDAPNFCQFDPFSLTYRCQFGVEDSAVRLDKVDPTYPHQKDTTPVFGIGDDINLTLTGQQQQPLDTARNLDGTKFILYTLQNQNGNTIKQLTEQDSFLLDNTLKETGTFTKPLIITGAITPENFASTTTQTSQTFTQQLLEKGTIVSASTTTLSDFKADEQVPFIIRFTGNTFSVYEGANSIKDGQYVTSTTTPIASADVSTNIGKPLVYTYTKQGIPGTLSGTATKTVTLTIKEPPKNDGDIIITQQPTPQDPCKDQDPSKRPIVQWTATVSIHDADKNGRPTSQTSIDPTTGQEAKQEIKINVLCLAGPQIPTKTPTPTELATQGLCNPAPYTQNTQPCYCGPPTTEINTPNCGTTNTGMYCINGQYCSNTPLCKPATKPEDINQQDCTCSNPKFIGPVQQNCKKSQYCCATDYSCQNDFKTCPPSTPNPTSSTTGTTASTITALSEGDEISYTQTRTITTYKKTGNTWQETISGIGIQIVPDVLTDAVTNDLSKQTTVTINGQQYSIDTNGKITSTKK